MHSIFEFFLGVPENFREVRTPLHPPPRKSAPGKVSINQTMNFKNASSSDVECMEHNKQCMGKLYITFYPNAMYRFRTVAF